MTFADRAWLRSYAHQTLHLAVNGVTPSYKHMMFKLAREARRKAEPVREIERKKAA